MRSSLVLSLVLALAGPAALAAGAAEAPPAELEWKKAIQEKLERKNSFEFEDWPIDAVLSSVENWISVPFIRDPAAADEIYKTKITLELKDTELSAMLAKMLRLAGLEYRLVHRAVLITKRGAPDPAFSSVRAGKDDPEAKKAILARLGRKVSFEFMDTPYDQAVAFIREVAQVGIILDPRVTGERMPRRVTLSMKNVPMHVALDWITWLGGMKWEVRDRVYITAAEPEKKTPAPAEAVTIHPPAVEVKPRPVKGMAVEFVGTPAGECIDFIRATAGVDIVVHPDCGARLKTPITFKAKGMSFGQVLDWVMRLARLEHELKDGVIFITPAE